MITGMREAAVCRAVALPRHFEGEYQTTHIVKDGRMIEHLICAHVAGNAWLVHPGANLDPGGLIRR